MKNLLLIILLLPFLVFSQHQEERSYSYDNLNSLVEVVFHNGDKVEYEYDELGNRTKRIVIRNEDNDGNNGNNGNNGINENNDNEGNNDNSDNNNQDNDNETIVNYAELQFEIETINLTCRDADNGAIRVNGLDSNHEYTVKIMRSGQTISNSSLLASNNWEQTLSQLSANEYSIHITIDGVSSIEFEKIYRITITEPAPLFVSSGKSVFSSSKRYFDIENGTAPFKVYKNGTFQTESHDPHIEIETEHLDVVEVHSAKSCEGIYKEQIFNEVYTLYPNPVTDEVYIQLPKGVRDVTPLLFDENGRLLYSLGATQNNRLLHIELPNLPVGLFYLKLEPVGKTFKLLKE